MDTKDRSGDHTEDLATAHEGAGGKKGSPDGTSPELHAPRVALTWSVGGVAERLDLAPSTLRTWDRRYGIGPSQRTEGGHRRYDEVDIQRVRLMAQLTGRGVPAGTAARVATSVDAAGLASALGPGTGFPAAGQGASDSAVEAIVSSAAALDADGLARIYQRVTRESDLVSAWTSVLAPALRRIGERWSDGSMGVDSEHLASELLVTELRSLTRANRARVGGRREVVLASADEEQHYLPLVAIEAELSLQGIGCVFLGPRVPVEALIDLVGRASPPVVFLWASISRPANDPLWAALSSVERPLKLVVGGPGWPEDLEVASPSVTMVRANSLDEACEALSSSVFPAA
ncbi:MerR family transcriptional regulator [Knoellia sp. 3-2P3]|uniref:MerR family transcriptional regulator n=1 Tax=unclassified Knoellia TaxID=2618719 RepID=UPI0023DBAEF0|nr:MerR family transcriptional regulator [Knoellia sp. 3-2P3]MDF2092040.1 MerR family transcriptional regulator [Knoellia sp. 3-2P3]